MNLGELNKLRTRYVKTEDKPNQNFMEDVKKGIEKITYISDSELLDKINSDKYKLHPVYPIIINCDGTDIYDIRDNFNILIANKNKTHKKRKACCVLGYGKKILSRLIAESWYNRVLNDHYLNLKIMNKYEHCKLHGINIQEYNLNEFKKNNYSIKWLHNKKKQYKKNINKRNQIVSSERNNISNEDILNRLNNGNFSMHPKYPIIVSHDGKDIYDIRDNSKLILVNKHYIILDYGQHTMINLVAEAWNNRTLSKNEYVIFRDGNINNSSFKNLKIYKRNSFLPQFNSLNDFMDINEIYNGI